MQPIEKTFWTIFTVIGFATIAGLVVLFAYFAFDTLMDVVRLWRWRRKYKHRFDKPPTAACYCKDCKWHSEKDNRCSNVTWADRHTPDNGFCYEAEPRKKDIDND